MSLLTTQQITLDLTVPRVQNVRCVQDDQNTRLVRIVVTNNGEPFPLNPETMIISYKVCKPDSRYIWNKTGVTINDDGTVTVDLSEFNAVTREHFINGGTVSNERIHGELSCDEKRHKLFGLSLTRQANPALCKPNPHKFWPTSD